VFWLFFFNFITDDYFKSTQKQQASFGSVYILYNAHGVGRWILVLLALYCLGCRLTVFQQMLLESLRIPAETIVDYDGSYYSVNLNNCTSANWKIYLMFNLLLIYFRPIHLILTISPSPRDYTWPWVTSSKACNARLILIIIFIIDVTTSKHIYILFLTYVAWRCLTSKWLITCTTIGISV